jgi:tRNA uridine 5-carbamoylmethylation protein Kti12
MDWTIEESPYALYFLKKVSVLEPGKVINRSELIGGEPGAERDLNFNLEPEILMVILAALMRQGNLSINIQGVQLAESDFSNGTHLTLEQLLRFTSISKPKPIPEQVVKELFSQFGLDPDIINDPRTLSLGINQLQQAIQSELNDVVRMTETLREGPKFWGEKILFADDQKQARKEVESYRDFLSGLQSITTVARLANLQVGVGEIRAAVKVRKAIKEIQSIIGVLRELDSVWEYLLSAQPLLPAKDEWQNELASARKYVITTLADSEKRNAPNISGQLRARLENVQTSYISRYLALHKEFRLDREQDDLKKRLSADPRWARLRALSKLSLLPSKPLQDLQDRLGAVETCPTLQPSELKIHASCPHCGFNPITVQDIKEKASARLESIQNEFETLYRSWIEVLLANLKSDEAAHNIQAIDAGERSAVEEFLHSGKLPEPLNQRFIDGIENTLQGLEVVSVDGTEYLLALTQPGMPCTADELEKRIREFLQKQIEGKDRKKIRIQINW